MKHLRNDHSRVQVENFKMATILMVTVNVQKIFSSDCNDGLVYGA